MRGEVRGAAERVSRVSPSRGEGCLLVVRDRFREEVMGKCHAEHVPRCDEGGKVVWNDASGVGSVC